MKFFKLCFVPSFCALLVPLFSEAQVSSGFIAQKESSIFESCSRAAQNYESFLVHSKSEKMRAQYCECVARVTVEGELQNPDTREERREPEVEAEIVIFQQILENWGSYESKKGSKTYFDMQKLPSPKEKVLFEAQLVRMESCVRSK